MSRLVTLAFCCAASISLASVAYAQKKAIASTVPDKTIATALDASGFARLPVKRVVLYKNGVGYFEHNARVHGNQELAIDFTTGQLNDVLKSLTVVDLGEGHIGSVRYNSIAPLAERLRSLRLPFGEQVSSEEFLSALRGARVDVRSGASSATGRLLSVQKERKQNGKGDYVDVTTLAIVTDSGEMRNFELGAGTSVRLAERDLSDEVGRYLNLVGSSRARDLRRMTISATGSGDRNVFVSYISEVPVWKSTYRIILPEKPDQKPLLQGWAIVDNTVGEDWKDVQLSLVAGAPQSFIQDISQPYYTRRPVVAPPESLMLSPQTHEATMNAAPGPPPSSAGTGGLQGTVTDPSGAVLAGASVTVRNEETGASQTTTSDANGKYRFYNVPAGNSALFVSAPGFKAFNLSNIYLGVGRMNEIRASLQPGSAAETIDVRAEAATLNMSSAMISTALSKQISEAEGKGFGDFFEYAIKQAVTINKNQSALVPILNARVEAEKVTLWSGENAEDSDSDHPARALRALWIRNTSGETLDSGTFNILEKDTFAGEGVLDAIHPGERRLLSYAADTAVHVVTEDQSSDEPITRVRIAKGLMITTREQRESRLYRIRNADSAPRQVVVEHPAKEDWKLVNEGPKAEESTASFHRFRVNVAPNSTADLKVETYHPLDSSFALTNLDQQQVGLWTEQGRVTPAMREAFGRVLGKKNEIAVLDIQLKERHQERDGITADQSRLRENMKALKGSAEEKALLQRYTRQLDQQEDRLVALQNEVVDLIGKKVKADDELSQMIQAIVVDEKF
jgi:CheY-like chemotaxis protein